LRAGCWGEYLGLWGRKWQRLEKTA